MLFCLYCRALWLSPFISFIFDKEKSFLWCQLPSRSVTESLKFLCIFLCQQRSWLAVNTCCLQTKQRRKKTQKNIIFVVTLFLLGCVPLFLFTEGILYLIFLSLTCAFVFVFFICKEPKGKGREREGGEESTHPCKHVKDRKWVVNVPLGFALHQLQCAATER